MLRMGLDYRRTRQKEGVEETDESQAGMIPGLLSNRNAELQEERARLNAVAAVPDDQTTRATFREIKEIGQDG